MLKVASRKALINNRDVGRSGGYVTHAYHVIGSRPGQEMMAVNKPHSLHKARITHN